MTEPLLDLAPLERAIDRLAEGWQRDQLKARLA